MSAPDFLDELIAECEAHEPGFAAKVNAAVERRVAERLAADRGTPHKCPVCDGKGYRRWVNSPCPTCKGDRILWSRP